MRTGDQLDFTLLEERRLQISLTRRAVLEQQHLADGFPATPDVPGQHGKSSTSSDEGQLLQQVLPLSSLPACCTWKPMEASAGIGVTCSHPLACQCQHALLLTARRPSTAVNSLNARFGCWPVLDG